MSDAEAKIVGDYVSQRNVYLSYTKTLTALLERLLSVNNVVVHSIDFRCKTVESLAGKVAKKGKYSDLSEVTDLAGIRIITLFASDVDVVARLIEQEFAVDHVNSIDKRAAIDPDRFGYLSLHYVVSLNESRGKLQEYSGFTDLKLEVQVRSILQHAWAEIEHDIGYKSVAEVPKQIRRRFSRLAGLLELADQEFTGIRNDLDKYAAEVDEAIENRAEEILLDKVSIEAFVQTNALCLELDREIANLRGAELKGSLVSEKLILSLQLMRVNSLAAIEENLVIYKDDILRRAEYVAMTSPKIGRVQTAICLFFMVQVMAAKTKNKTLIEEYVVINGWGKQVVDYLMDF